VAQGGSLMSEFVSQGMTHGQIIVQSLSEGIHRTPPSQGRAKVRKALKSTLA
jgi:hypothetical protein